LRREHADTIRRVGDGDLIQRDRAAAGVDPVAELIPFPEVVREGRSLDGNVREKWEDRYPEFLDRSALHLEEAHLLEGEPLL
jgi:hypothetical protein